MTGAEAQTKFIEDNMDKPEYKVRWGDQPIFTFARCWYTALAVAAINPDAYVFMPKGAAFADESLFR